MQCKRFQYWCIEIKQFGKSIALRAQSHRHRRQPKQKTTKKQWNQKKTTQFEHQEARNNYIYIYVLPSFFRRHKNHPHNLSTSWGLQTEKVPIRSRFQKVSSYHHCKWILLLLFLQFFFTAEHCSALHCTALVPWVALPGPAPSPAPAATALHVTKERVSRFHDSLHSWGQFPCLPPTYYPSAINLFKLWARGFLWSTWKNFLMRSSSRRA